MAVTELEPLENTFPLFRVQTDETPCHLLDLCLGVCGAAEMRCIAAGQAIVRIDGDHEPRKFQFSAGW